VLRLRMIRPGLLISCFLYCVSFFKLKEIWKAREDQ
jgi:hypothetical protein